MDKQIKNLKNILKALVFMTSRCDGAKLFDAKGFSKSDTDFAFSLHSQMPGLSIPQLVSAYEMLESYPAQLAEGGFNLIKPEFDKVTILQTEERIAVYFNGRPSQEHLEIVKDAGGRWLPDTPGKPWAILPEQAHNVVDKFPTAKKSKSVREIKPTSTVKNKMGKIYLKNNTIYIEFGRRPTKKERANLDRLPSRVWEPDISGMPWTTPARHARWVTKLFPNLNIKKSVNNLIALHEELAIFANDKLPDEYDDRLFDYQRVGVNFLRRSGGNIILADDMGLGKTIQALQYIDVEDKYPALLVVPSFLKFNWREEALQWTGLKKKDITILSGQSPTELELKPVTIINYAILSHWENELSKHQFEIMVLDEAHYISNQKTNRSKAVSKINSRERLLLTGTPIRNNTIDIWNLLNTANPNAWPNWWRFGKRYCDFHKNNWGLVKDGTSNQKELNTILEPYMLRRLKDNELDLPDKLFNTLTFELEPEYKRKQDILMAEKIDTDMETIVYIEKAKQLAAEAKMNNVIKWIENFLDSGKKLFVAGIHIKVAKQLYKRFNDTSVIIIGDTSDKERHEAVQKFQNDKNVKLLIGNIEAAGVGITLTAASDILIIEFPWLPSSIQQVIDRIYRIGQDKTVNVWFAEVDNTIEQSIIKLLIEKSKNINQIVDGHKDETINIRKDIEKAAAKQLELFDKKRQGLI